VQPSPIEIRVLGALVEKQRTTPEQYPLTLNSLRLACNQSTNRDPVVDYDEADIKDAVQRLRQRGWVRFASGHHSRAAKYRHLLDQALGLGRDELAILCVLMLRGAQTPGELKQRTERLHGFASLEELEGVLQRLIERDLAERVARRGSRGRSSPPWPPTRSPRRSRPAWSPRRTTGLPTTSTCWRSAWPRSSARSASFGPR
jgi:uncharacterized protein